jgi:hypothetical protein
MDPDPAIFVSDLQDINRKLFFLLSFFAVLLFLCNGWEHYVPYRCL